MDGKLRSVAKSFSYRITGTAATTAITYAATQELSISLGVGVAEIISKPLLYYLHERIWNKINYDRNGKESKLEKIS